MKAEINTLKCGRENDLVGFLYGELDATEKQSFQHHVQDCAECSSQLSSFDDIRESVVSWRNESLGVLTSPVAYPAAAKVDHSRPSAMAALREFFNLSPLWMKGTVAFASLLFCLFAVLAAARLMKTPETTIVNKTDNNAASAKALDSEIERRVKEELKRRDDAQKEKALVATANSSADNSAPRPLKRNQLASVVPQRKAGRPLSKLERQELAGDLRLVPDSGDGELVLIGDRINQ